MKLDFDLKNRTVGFSVAKKLYSREALQIAAHIFDSRAEVRAAEGSSAFEIELAAKRKSAGAPELTALAGDFVNELLNQEYRFVVSAFNKKIASLIVTQTLVAARGGENPPAPPEGENTPEFKAKVDALMAEAAAEIKRTMPKKLPPQGNPLPPAEEHV
jgi:His-Xaa-Ser system protein HxsD